MEGVDVLLKGQSVGQTVRGSGVKSVNFGHRVVSNYNYPASGFTILPSVHSAEVMIENILINATAE